MKPIYITAMNPVATLDRVRHGARAASAATWDRDDAQLTYDVYRDGGPPIGTVTSKSVFWKLPPLIFTDTGQTPGTTHTYKVRAKDAAGNVQWTLATNAVVVSAATPSAYASRVRADGAQHLWRLENGATQALDADRRLRPAPRPASPATSRRRAATAALRLERRHDDARSTPTFAEPNRMP